MLEKSFLQMLDTNKGGEQKTNRNYEIKKYQYFAANCGVNYVQCQSYRSSNFG